MVRKLVLSFLSATLLYFSPTVNADSTELLGEDQTDKIVDSYAKLFHFEATSSDKISVMDFYDTEDNLLGKYYQLEEDGEQYYMLVSVNTEYSPLFAAGKGEIKINEVDKNGKLFYLGSLALFKAKESDGLVESINKNNKNKTKFKKSDFKVDKNPEAKEKWNKILGPQGSKNISIMSYSEKTLDVDPFTQWETGVTKPASSCGPATMAAILNYWKEEKGISQIRGLDYYSTKPHMINHMWQYHGGSILGMSISSLKTGYEVHVEESTDESDYQIDRSTFNNFFTYKYNIDDEEPVAVKFDKWFTLFEPDADYDYDYHWTVGVGYVHDGTTDQILIIQDNGVKYTDGTWDWSKEVYIDYPTNKAIISMVDLRIH